MHESITRILKIKSALTREYMGREPSSKEIAEQLGWNAEKVQFLLDISSEPLSLDTPVSEDKESLSSVIRTSMDSPERIAIAREQSMQIDSVILQLNPRERMIIERRFGLDGLKPQTLETLGHGLNLTRERIRQIEAKALEKLRHPVRRILLAKFWPSASPSPQSDTTGESAAGRKTKQKAKLKGRQTP